jgi:NAD(P) transhydrogenase subunit alpha
MLVVGAFLLLGVGLVAPASFMQHFIVFVPLSLCRLFSSGVAQFAHAVMAVTSAIPSIIILGALTQIDSGLLAIFWRPWRCLTGINIFGGFLATHARHVPEVLKG